MRFLKSFILVLVPLLALAPNSAHAVGAQAGPYRVGVSTDPSIVPVGAGRVIVHLTNSSDKPVNTAKVRIFAQMPGMPMGEREQAAEPVPGKPGTFAAPAVFGMAGEYGVRVSIDGPEGPATASVSLQTGQDTGSSGRQGPSFGPIALALAAIGSAIWIALRMRKIGVAPDLSGLRTGRTLVSLMVLLAVIVCTVWAVDNLRRPGAMTPLGAQGMEMSTPAPPGSAAVTLASVTRGSIESTVRYTGQAVGYVEQDVFPRVTGTLISMSLYVGDRVHVGQVLARLDTSQLEPQVSEKRAMADAARQGVDSAEADFEAAAAMVKQADAEHGQYMSGIQEARANVAAARDGEAAMAAQAASVEADISSARAKRRSAQADADYWSQELGRMDRLFKAGAVSRDDYQQTVTQETKARAAVQQVDEDVRSAEAKLSAAKAADRQANSSIGVAQRRLDEANNLMLVHRAHVASSNAMRDSARTKIALAAAGVRQAEADLAAAAANEGYATITSSLDGMVTQRNATQGALVQPGTSILRIAQIDPIRIQANVPTSDLELVHLGTHVRMRTSISGGSPIEASITSVSPSVDPTARTGIVEALLRNSDHRILPGQFVSMEIATGLAQDVPLVPNEAIQSGSGPSHVWVADPVSEAGQFVVHQVTVELGASDGRNTAILAGLREGQKVVTSGFINLQEGASVTAPDAPENGAVRSPRGSTTVVPRTGGQADFRKVIRVTAAGFIPSAVTIPTGEPAKLTFLRTTDNCAKEVVFPELGIRQSLPLNHLVTVDLGPGRKKTYTFTCGLGMFKSTVVVR